MKNVLFCVVMGLLLIGCSQNDEIINQESEKLVSKAAASEYYISPTSVTLRPYSLTAPGRDSALITIEGGSSLWGAPEWTTDSRLLYDATVAPGGKSYSFAIYAAGDQPYGKVKVVVNGINVGIVTVYTGGNGSGSGSGYDSTILDAISDVDLQ